jgi:hypothetical protein
MSKLLRTEEAFEAGRPKFEKLDKLDKLDELGRINQRLLNLEENCRVSTKSSK